MGRSKFPGKPSKLVTKKRVSVLNGNNNGINSSQTNLVGGAAVINATNINEANNDNDTATDLQINQNSNDIAESEDESNLNAKCDVIQVRRISIFFICSQNILK